MSIIGNGIYAGGGGGGVDTCTINMNTGTKWIRGIQYINGEITPLIMDQTTVTSLTNVVCNSVLYIGFGPRFLGPAFTSNGHTSCYHTILGQQASPYAGSTGYVIKVSDVANAVDTINMYDDD